MESQLPEPFLQASQFPLLLHLPPPAYASPPDASVRLPPRATDISKRKTEATLVELASSAKRFSSSSICFRRAAFRASSAYTQKKHT
jgi:hypothetical protein